MRRNAITIALLIGFLSASLASVTQLALGFEVEAETSIWVEEKNTSSETNRGPRAVKRSQRGKPSLKSLPKLDTPPSKAIFVGWTKHTAFIAHVHKSSIYQQKSVYRI